MYILVILLNLTIIYYFQSLSDKQKKIPIQRTLKKQNGTFQNYCQNYDVLEKIFKNYLFIGLNLL